MANSHPLSHGLPLSKRTRVFRDRALSVLIGAVATVCVPSVHADETEPLYYIYRGQQRPLTLDGEHIAVRTRANSSGTLPQSLTAHGFTDADVVERPMDNWVIVRSRTLADHARTNAVSAAPRNQAVAVHNVVRALATTADSSTDFVSPVFRSSKGTPLIITPRLLIGFTKDFPASERTRLQAQVPEGASSEYIPYRQPNDDRWQLRSGDGFAVLARANELARTPGVAYAEPDMIVTGHTNLVPTDPQYSSSWGPGFLSATLAWDITLGSPSVLVLILDSGIQQNHPDINQIAGHDFTPQAGSNPTGGPLGPNENHGTWVAGCVSERINNGIGTTGVAPGVNCVSARIGTNYTTGGTFTAENSWTVDALNWAQSMGVRVTNNSNGYDEVSNAIDAAYTNTHANGMVHFAAAGNESAGHVDYPASSPNVNSVGALARNGFGASFSNYGPGLKFVAPGENILTTDRTGSAGENGDYTVVSGTSFASPYAAAVAALVISVHPDWTADQVEQQMQATCRDLLLAGYDEGSGYGVPNAFRAVGGSIPSSSPTPTPTSSPTPTPTATPVSTPTVPPSASGPTQTVRVATSRASVIEGGTAQFIISASPINPTQPLTVHYSIAGRAARGLDYTTDGTGQAVIPAGASSVAVTIHALTDAARERSEKLTLTLSAGPRYTLSRVRAQRKATISIVNQVVRQSGNSFER